MTMNATELGWEIVEGDCRERMALMPAASVDAIVTDPPYGLSFMGKGWDHGVPGLEFWQAALRVAKPGAHLLAFGGTRTFHRLMCAIEDAGWEIRDTLGWLYGSGFPKSLDVGKAIDKVDASEKRRERQLRFTAWMRENCRLGPTEANNVMGTAAEAGHFFTDGEQPHIATREHFDKLRPFFACEVPSWVEELVSARTVESENFKRRNMVGTHKGDMGGLGGTRLGLPCGAITEPATAEAREWSGWGTALKPAWEPIVLARKPLDGTVAENVLRHGCGGINVEGCRVGGETLTQGRWPANVLHDGSEDVLVVFPERAGAVSNGSGGVNVLHDGSADSAARFFYCAKASRRDREEGMDGFAKVSPGGATERADGSAGLNCPRAGAGRTSGAQNHHPTVKPAALMRYLCRLVTRPGGLVLDPFCGSGSTGKAALLEGFRFLGLEREGDYCAIARARCAAAVAGRN